MCLMLSNEIFGDVKQCRLVGNYIAFCLLGLLASKAEGTSVFRNVGNYLPLDMGVKCRI
jgi:hypothetical protein